MKKKLLRHIAESDKEMFRNKGLVFLPGLFDNDWIKLLKEGVRKNIENPSKRMRIWDRTDKEKITLYDNDNWRRIQEYHNFIYESPSKEIACNLLDTSKVNFFFDAIFIRSKGVEFQTPWHQDEPYWTVKGLDTIIFWIPLVPVEKKSALSFVPGSHLWRKKFKQKDFGDLNPDKQLNVDSVNFKDEWELFPDIESDLAKYKVISWDMMPGDCVAFNGRTIHGGSGKLDPKRDLQIFNIKWLGEDARVQYKPYGMDPDHSKKMKASGMKDGDRIDKDIYPSYCLKNGWLKKQKRHFI